MRKLPYKVIGTYHPAEGATPEQIGLALEDIVAKAGLVATHDRGWGGSEWSDNNGAEVRLGHVDEDDNDPVTRWHHDADLKELQIVLWANKSPTQLKYKWGTKIYQPEPFEVIVFSNTKLMHRKHGDE